MNVNQTYKKRNSGSNLGEEMALEYFTSNDITYGRFGYDEIKKNRIPTEQFVMLDYRLRKRPDYIVCWNERFSFVEVKLCGKDGLRLKDCDVKGYKYWNKTFPVWIFVYNANTDQQKLILLNDIIKISEDCEYQEMWDNKEPYRLIPFEKIKNVL